MIEPVRRRRVGGGVVWQRGPAHGAHPVPASARAKLLLRVGAALTCGTDLRIYRRGYQR